MGKVRLEHRKAALIVFTDNTWKISDTHHKALIEAMQERGYIQETHIIGYYEIDNDYIIHSIFTERADLEKEFFKDKRKEFWEMIVNE